MASTVGSSRLAQASHKLGRAAEIAGTLHCIYTFGRGVYSAGVAAAPYLARLGMLAL